MTDASDPRKVQFIPHIEARPMTAEEQACDCGCEEVERTPAADLTYYAIDPVAAGVSTGYVVVRRFGQPTEVATVTLLHDGEGNAVGDVEPESWRHVQIEGDL